MTGLQILVVALCGLLIGLALYLLVRSLRKMVKGRCCEGCDGCSQTGNCSSLKAVEDRKKRNDHAGKE